MKSILVCVALVSMAWGGGWTVLAELPDAFLVNYFRAYGNGEYGYGLLEETDGILFISDISVDIHGNQTVSIPRREIHISEDKSFLPLYVPVPFPDDIESADTFAGVICIGASGDTLWTVMLDSLDRKQSGLRVISSREGGCFAVFPPTWQDFIWKVYRLSGSGEVLMSGEFQMQGGPVLSIDEVVETADAGFLISGTTDDLGMNLFMYLVGIDSSGNQFLEVREDFRFHAGCDDVALDKSGNIYISGYTGYDRDDGYFMPPQNTDVFLMKLDPRGRELWRTVFDYPLENSSSIVDISDSGEVLVVIRSFSYEAAGRTLGRTLLLFQEE